MTTTKALEDRARRAAKRIGLCAIKSRSLNPLVNHGGFMLVDPSTNFPVAGFQFDLDYVEVIEYCEEDE